VLKKALPPCGGKKAYEKRLLPLRGGKIGREGSRSLPKDKDTQCVACVLKGHVPSFHFWVFDYNTRQLILC
jgi:hypothetical protein